MKLFTALLDTTQAFPWDVRSEIIIIRVIGEETPKNGGMLVKSPKKTDWVCEFTSLLGVSEVAPVFLV